MSEKTAIVTGACGLVGAEVVDLLVEQGFFVVGIDNNMRKHFFGEAASTEPRARALERKYTREEFELHFLGVEERHQMAMLFASLAGENVELVVHTAAQPSHDWAAKEPYTDFGVNAVGTLNLLEATRALPCNPTFCHISTSKVYGDIPNTLQLEEFETRLDLRPTHVYWQGIDTTMPVEGPECIHSLFGISKLSGDLLVQEYGRYFDMPTVCFRPGCVTGPGHAGAELHGFLSYLVKCVVKGQPYTIFGYGGKQVRCNIYARDLASACLLFHESPRPGAVFNIGGGRENSCSVLEAVEIAEGVTGKKLAHQYSDEARIGDHRWWISSNEAFEEEFPLWQQTRDVPSMIEEIASAS